ncbi:MAG: M1 family aminopeptidase [Polyangiaceae bacterium]
MRRFASLAVCSLVLGCSSCDRSARGPKSGYDATPLLESLRPSEAGRAEKQLATPLDALPYYALELKVAQDLKSFELKETLYFRNTGSEPLSDVGLRLYVNATRPTPLVTLKQGSCLDGLSCTVQPHGGSALVLKLKEPLAPGKSLRAELQLSGTLTHIEPSRTSMLSQSLESMQRMRSGKGAGDYGLLAEGDGIASFAAFYPVLARRTGDAWELEDQSSLGDLAASGLSHVSLELELPENVEVASSGHVKQTKTLDANRKRLSIRAGMVRDVALLMSADFKHESRAVGDVTVRSHFLARDAKAGRKVLDAAEHSLRVFEKRFGPYPYRDLDVVEAPLVGGAGGVEFSGLVTVASMFYRPRLADGSLGMLTKLLGGPNQAELEQMTEGILEFVTAHEVAHQYFPGLVGSDIRKHPYADEAMAQWAAMLYFEDRYGKARAEDEGKRQVLANYHMMRLMEEPDAAVDRPVDAFGSELAYAGLVYGKGPYYFAALRKTVGDAAFFRALRTHVDTHRYREAPPRALSAALAKSGDKAAVDALTRRWLDEHHGDADLGGPDLKLLLGAWLGPEMSKEISPEMEMALKLMLKLMTGKGGGGDLGGLLDGLLGGAMKGD